MLSSVTLRKHEKFTILDALKYIFRGFSLFLHLISNGVSTVSTHCHRLWLCKGTQPFDFIKRNVIRKVAHKVKYISQINGGLIMFFAN